MLAWLLNTILVVTGVEKDFKLLKIEMMEKKKHHVVALMGKTSTDMWDLL